MSTRKWKLRSYHPITTKEIAWFKELQAQGFSAAAIARITNRCASSVREHLNPAYREQRSAYRRERYQFGSEEYRESRRAYQREYTHFTRKGDE